MEKAKATSMVKINTKGISERFDDAIKDYDELKSIIEKFKREHSFIIINVEIGINERETVEFLTDNLEVVEIE